MEEREEWAQFIRNELRRKAQLVEKTPARPSEELIQHRLKTYGTKCYEAAKVTEEAMNEYVNLMACRDDYYNRRGGALQFYLKLKQLHKEHELHVHELKNNAELFMMSHDWYEILVVADEAQELDRLAFLRSLNEEEVFESSNPEDSSYPQPVKVHRSYERNDVARFTQLQLVRLQTVLDEEKTSVEEAKFMSKTIGKYEAEVLSDLRFAMEDLKGEVTSYIQNTTQQLDDMKKALKSTCRLVHGILDHVERREDVQERHNSQFMESITNHYDDIKSKFDEVFKRIDGLKLEKEDKSKQDADKRSTKRRYHDTSDDDIEEYRGRIASCEEELNELDKFLENNVVRERQFGPRLMKKNEQQLKCVYCHEIGNHYSDACPIVTTVQERTTVLLKEKRCTICLELHYGSPCAKSVTCFYCNSSQPRITQNSDHHSSLCIRPERFVEVQNRRRELQSKMVQYYDAMEDLRSRKRRDSTPETKTRSRQQDVRRSSN
ncbi:unnamed protein product [Nippostrongylus brasiliensis]|uniref:CCHC-type domain-containing protein n=1 Tax=Nippostrongylus brasiliensis TaxID=27835 RepID=A0A0N4YN07_NIPBR|nr:unnamed protein product [Nippostrongylus brasiliensis]